jgi:hypothetical protein
MQQSRIPNLPKTTNAELFKSSMLLRSLRHNAESHLLRLPRRQARGQELVLEAKGLLRFKLLNQEELSRLRNLYLKILPPIEMRSMQAKGDAHQVLPANKACLHQPVPSEKPPDRLRTLINWQLMRRHPYQLPDLPLAAQ